MDGTNYEYFSIIEAGAQSVIRFRSSISGSTAAMDEVQQELIDFIGRNTCQKLIIDLSDTAYLPSSVIGVLAVICSRGVEELHLANASPDIVHVMEVMGLNRRIHINEFELSCRNGKENRRAGISAGRSYRRVCGRMSVLRCSGICRQTRARQFSGM